MRTGFCAKFLSKQSITNPNRRLGDSPICILVRLYTTSGYRVDGTGSESMSYSGSWCQKCLTFCFSSQRHNQVSSGPVFENYTYPSPDWDMNWDVTPCRLEDCYRRFGGTRYIYLQIMIYVKQGASLLLRISSNLHIEEMFHRNVDELQSNHKASHSIKQKL